MITVSSILTVIYDYFDEEIQEIKIKSKKTKNNIRVTHYMLATYIQ